MKMLVTEYSSRSTADRGAKRAGLVGYEIVKNTAGKWVVIDPKAKNLEPGIYNVELTDMKVVGDDVKIGTRIAEEQPQLSPETSALADKVIEDAKHDLEKLAATLPPRTTSTPEEIAARRAERQARIAADKEKKANEPKVPSYKELHRAAPQKSVVLKPVDAIRAYLDENYNIKSRKQCIAELVAMGINMTTCRTQYQIYRKKNGAPVVG